MQIAESYQPSGWEACCDKCRQNSQCVSWTWHKNGVHTWCNTCLLFNGIPTEKRADTWCISGTVNAGTFCTPFRTTLLARSKLPLQWFSRIQRNQCIESTKISAKWDRAVSFLMATPFSPVSNEKIMRTLFSRVGCAKNTKSRYLRC